MIRIRRGTSLLNKVVKNFERATADLEVAAQQIEAKRQKTVEQLAKLERRAEIVRDNIAKLIEA